MSDGAYVQSRQPWEEEAALYAADRALAAAIDASMTTGVRHRATVAFAFRALREACFEAPGRALEGLAFPLDETALDGLLERPCGEWLPYAHRLGVERTRLALCGLATSECRSLAQQQKRVA